MPEDKDRLAIFHAMLKPSEITVLDYEMEAVAIAFEDAIEAIERDISG